MLDSYKVLGVVPPLSVETLKLAYRKAASVHHPDLGGSHLAMVRVNEAYEQLKNQLSGGSYDAPPRQQQTRKPEVINWKSQIDKWNTTMCQKGYKRAWVMYQLLESETKPPLEAWEYAAKVLGYKKGWAYHKYQDNL